MLTPDLSLEEDSTIVAVSTPAGSGAIAVIRMSGDDCLDILSKRWKGCDLEEMIDRRAYLGHILDAEGGVIDQVLLTYFPGPNSYTGEDTMEISCHGSTLITKLILKSLTEAGAVTAQPGEFTQRAFVNQKLDLTQAEAVMDILNAQSTLALKAAQDQLDGALGNAVLHQVNELLHVLAHIEAYIDFPDEDIAPDTVHELSEKLTQISAQIDSLLHTAEQGKYLREGVRTVLIGPPNAGKSSLLNVLLGYERAIVSDQPGTTRDTLEETLHLAGYTLRLIDTAGLRSEAGTIEQLGIERTYKALDHADLVLEMIDATAPRSAHITDITPQTAHHLRILNKTDQAIHHDWTHSDAIPISCTTGAGIPALIEALADLLGTHEDMDKTHALIAINARHQKALTATQEALTNAQTSLRQEQSPEFIALYLREALSHLGDITGAVNIEDLLTTIFSSFCIGK